MPDRPAAPAQAPLSPLLTVPSGEPERAGDGAMTWQCLAAPHLCVGVAPHEFLYGGAALALCLTALERAVGCPVCFASAQFVSFAAPDELLDLCVRVVADGNSIKQAQITIMAGGRLVVAVHAALGQRSSPLMHQERPAPAVAPPLDCPATSVARTLGSKLNNLVEVRLAAGRIHGREPWTGPVPGPVTFWARARDGSATSREHLAILADFLSLGVPAALGRNGAGNSLDNHIRFMAPPEGDWVLCAIDIESIRDGLVHGQMRLYREDGALLALASQTMILRLRD